MRNHYHDAEPLLCLTAKHFPTGSCLAIEAGRRNQHQSVSALLQEPIARYGCPSAIHSDTGSELLGPALRDDLKKQGLRLGDIDPGMPSQNGNNKSLKGTIRQDCLNAETFASLTEAPGHRRAVASSFH